jgi:hypothetical protein
MIGGRLRYRLIVALLATATVVYLGFAIELSRQRRSEAYFRSLDEHDLVLQTMARGDVLVAALRRYKADRGEYPLSLRALVPDYVGRIDMPLAGTPRWNYMRWSTPERDACRLRFGFGAEAYPGFYLDVAEADAEWLSDF